MRDVPRHDGARTGIRRLLAAVLCAAAAGCRADDHSAAARIGDSVRGAALIGRFACGSCHTIPGIQFADGLAGPPLTRFSRQMTIAGMLPNTPDNLVKWIADPQAIVPGNAMPDAGLTEAQARDVAAYLYTLR